MNIGIGQPVAAVEAVPLQHRCLIDGEWHASASGKEIDVFNPATGEKFTTLSGADPSMVDAAVQAARRTFEAGTWRRVSAAERGRILWRLADLVEEHHESIARLETLDCGMPIVRTRVHIQRAIDALRYYAGMATKIYGRTSDISTPEVEYHTYTRHEPVGVAGLITPWNGPFLSATNKAAPALAAGCSIVMKPPEQASLNVLRFGELAMQAGVPAGVINVLTGLGSITGAALANHADVDKISFTGSTETGKALVHAAAGNLKRLSLELGGKSPVFVFNDADMDLAIPTCFRAIFANSGQVCVAGSRLYVQRRSLDRVLAGLEALVAKTRVGDGLDPATELGPLVSREQQSRVLGYIETGVEEGAELVAGGRGPDQPGYFVTPTIFLNKNPASRLIREEIFGPVLNVMPFDDLDDVAAIGNDTPYGLAAGIFTQNLGVAHKAASALRAGNVWINCYGIMDYSMPFGGFKQSGWGRENGYEGIDAFMERKSVYARL